MSYPPQPPPQPGWYPPPQQPRKRHTARNVILICLGALVVIIIAAVAIGGAKTPAPPGSSTVSTTTPGATAAAQPPATSAPAHSPTTVRFVVTGTAPGGASITYGSDSDNRTAPGSLGPLGSGAAVPWRGSVPFDGSAQYYDVNAQLQGGGDITCKIVVTGPGDVPLVVASGHASGQYSICSAQAAPDDPSGLTWTKE